MAGNANSGPKREKPWIDALRMELAAGGDDHKSLRQIARVVIAQAKSGDLAAVREIADRLDGKPIQSIESQAVIEHKFARAPEKAADDEWKQFLANKASGSNGLNGRSGNGPTH